MKEKHVWGKWVFRISNLVGSETGNTQIKFIYKMFLSTVRSVLCILLSTPGMMGHVSIITYRMMQ